MEKKEESRELVRSDINLEKWSIFTNRKQVKERTLTRTTAERTEQVKIGISVRDGKSHILTATDGKIFYTLLKKMVRLSVKVGAVIRILPTETYERNRF